MTKKQVQNFSAEDKDKDSVRIIKRGYKSQISSKDEISSNSISN